MKSSFGLILTFVLSSTVLMAGKCGDGNSMKSNTDSDTDTSSDTETGTDTGTDSGTDTGTDSGTDTGTDSDPETPADWNIENPLGSLDPNPPCDASIPIVSIQLTMISHVESPDHPETETASEALFVELLEDYVGASIPDVDSGAQTVSGVKYTKLSLMTGGEDINLVLDVIQMSRVIDGIDQNDVTVLSKLEILKNGSYVEVSSTIKEFKNITAIFSEVADYVKGIFDNMQWTLITKLSPNNVEYVLDHHLVVVDDPDRPKSINWDVKKVSDPYGAVEIPFDGHKNFCFEIVTEIDGGVEYYTEPKTVSEDKLWNEISGASNSVERTLTPDDYFEECLDGLATHCSRPLLLQKVRLVYAFGKKMKKDMPIPFEEDLTFVCPMEIEPVQDLPMGFIPGETRKMPFRIIGYKDTPMHSIELTTTEISDSTFGTLAFDPNKLTDTNGETTSLSLTASSNMADDAEATVTVRACENVPEGLLGFDENRQPIPWDLESKQAVKVALHPVVEVNTVAHHSGLEYQMDIKDTNSSAYYHSVEHYSLDEKISLNFTVELKNRNVQQVFDSDLGLKGQAIIYSGKATAHITVSDPIPNIETRNEDGYEIWDTLSPPCGQVSFSYQSLNHEHEIVLNNADVNLNVTYLHFIPDSDSVNKTHFLEGLSFSQVNPLTRPVVYKHKRTTTARDFDGPSCSHQYETSTTPILPVPLPISHAFPIPTWQFFDMSCFGLQSLMDTINENQQAVTLRKVQSDGETFDSLHLRHEINLTESDTAECWDYEDYSTTVHDGSLFGTFTWDYTADLLEGTFDLTTL